MPRKGEEEGWPAKGQKEKRTRENRSEENTKKPKTPRKKRTGCATHNPELKIYCGNFTDYYFARSAENFYGFFSSSLPGESALKNGGDIW